MEVKVKVKVEGKMWKRLALYGEIDRNPSASLSLTLLRNEKFEQYVRKKDAQT